MWNDMNHFFCYVLSVKYGSLFSNGSSGCEHLQSFTPWFTSTMTWSNTLCLARGGCETLISIKTVLIVEGWGLNNTSPLPWRNHFGHSSPRVLGPGLLSAGRCTSVPGQRPVSADLEGRWEHLCVVGTSSYSGDLIYDFVFDHQPFHKKKFDGLVTNNIVPGAQ